MSIERVSLLSPDGKKKMVVNKFMKDYYINKEGYLQHPSLAKRMKYFLFQVNVIRKIIIFFELIINTKFNFKKIKNSSFVIFDCELTESLEDILTSESYFILSTRVERIKEIFINKEIIFYIFKNFFKRSLKQNYLIAVIKNVSPKVVVTHIDNSKDFFAVSKVLEKEARFIAVQNGSRGDVKMSKNDITRKIFIPEFFCFGKYDENLYKEKEARVKKFESLGSLVASRACRYINRKNFALNTKRYDVCLISEPHSDLHNDEYESVKNFTEVVGLIAQFTHKLSKLKKLNLIFCGEGNKKDGVEYYFYKYFLKHYNFEIFHGPRNEFPSYQKILQSEVVIGHNSTLLREAISLDKKILCCNFTGNEKIEFPTEGICVLKEKNYEAFENRVLKILSMSKEEYFNGLNKNKDFIIASSTNTYDAIKEKLVNLN